VIGLPGLLQPQGVAADAIALVDLRALPEGNLKDAPISLAGADLAHVLHQVAHPGRIRCLVIIA
jgi:hypothetical protein